MSEQQQPKKRGWLKFVVIAVLLLAILAVVWLIMVMRQPEPGAVVTPEPLPGDDSWSRVEESGVLRVGTAADNPPFTYLDETYAISGFDAALIRAVGQRLGVDVEITDFAFTGLMGALQVNQVDAVIAALSVTPQREELVDFSNVYYFGDEGILVRNDSDIETVTSLDQLSGTRIGVQRLSIYEKWLREELVDTGKLPAENLFVYAKPEHAVRDLTLDFLDVVILDGQNAALFSTTSGIRFVESGIFPQRFAIAVSSGATALQNKINLALIDLQNDGTINNLKQTYLGLVPEVNAPTEVSPTATAPTATPEPEPEKCVDAMSFVSDLNLDDQNLTYFHDFRPNEPFQKGWRIKNNGTCTWTISYSLRFVYGTTNQSDMRGQPTALSRVVSPGETYDLMVNLVAPGANAMGRHVGYWQMHNAQGEAFGQTIWVAINVVSEATPTPTTQPTNQPTQQPTDKPTTQPTFPATSTPTATPDPGDDITEKPWYLVKYHDGTRLVELIPSTNVYIELEPKDQLTGHTGCNRVSGKYQVDGNLISFTRLNSGMMLCEKPDGIMAQEGSVIEHLQFVTEWRLNEDDLELLHIKDNEEEVLLVFTSKKPR